MARQELGGMVVQMWNVAAAEPLGLGSPKETLLM